MGAKANLTTESQEVLTGNDSVVIRQYNGGVTGGRTLDMTGFGDSVIKAGHIVVRKLDEDDKNYNYKPLGVAEGAYASLGSGEEYAGVVVASKPASEPLVGIMDDGRVNDNAMPYPITSQMRTALRTALPNLIFEHD